MFLFSPLDKKHKFLWNFEKTLKIFYENSIEILNFIVILGNLLLELEPSEITPFFYNIFSASEGYSPLPPKSASDIFWDFLPFSEHQFNVHNREVLVHGSKCVVRKGFLRKNSQQIFFSAQVGTPHVFLKGNSFTL